MVAIIYPGWPTIECPAFYKERAGEYTYAEMETKDWFVRNVQPDWVMLDCGANIGYYSILFSQLAYRGEVHAFEPTSTINMLRENVIKNKCNNVWLYSFALGDNVEFREDSIYRIWGQEPEKKLYPFITLDYWKETWARELERIDCIKIDVDSFDFEVLLGAERILREYNPWIIVELNDALKLREQSVDTVLEFMRSAGYDRHMVLDGENYLMKRGME
jgi:FkbM family methyltransferase